ncbi:MAG: type IX secretion system membrane protein PorP/SprF [Candidatus Dadabacteria bacterium]
MKTFLLSMGLLLQFAYASAQQKPYYTQYIMNNYILNPAITGIENYTDVKLSYRNQWTDIDGAPTTMYFSAHTPIGKQDQRKTATSFELPEGSLGDGSWDEYTPAAPHGGVGIIAINDKTGYISRGSLYGTIAYHIGISPKTSIAAGFLGGVSKMTLDRTQIKWATLNPNDPAIGYNENLKRFKPEVGAGIWIYSSDYFIGGSVLNIVPGKVTFTDKANYGNSFDPQYLGTAGVRFALNPDLSALPSVMIQYVKDFPVQIHYNLKMQIQDKAWAGVSYRATDDLGGFAAMAGLNVNSTFNVSYAYDVPSKTKYMTKTGNTHEIVLGFMLSNMEGILCPRNIW